jgi:hypothetical protein
LLKSQPFEHDKRGAVEVDLTLAVPGHPGVWALGDCAAVNDAKTGKPCPPTENRFLLAICPELLISMKSTLEAVLRGEMLLSEHQISDWQRVRGLNPYFSLERALIYLCNMLITS